MNADLPTPWTETAARLAAVAVAAAAFSIDALLPVDINVGVFYAVAVVIAASAGRERFLWGLAAAALIFLLVGTMIGPPSMHSDRPDWLHWINRALTGATILIVTAIADRLVRLLRSLDAARATISARYADLSITNLELERDVEQRDARIRDESSGRQAAEAALRQAQKLEVLGHLTGGVAHDVKNLLTPIAASLDLLRRHVADQPRQLRLVDSAIQASDRAGALVQRLLAFARKQDLRAQEVRLAQWAGSTRDLIRHSVGQGVSVEIDVPDGTTAWVDPGQLELALLNLSINARDAMAGAGSLRIGVETRKGSLPSSAGEPLVGIAVADDGAGMDERTRARALEPFFSTKPVGQGTGLGLSMVYGFISQSGGQLEIRSEPGKGTTVVMWLRERRPRDAAVPPPPASGEQQPT
jgi:signal transduction histidine kinase